MKLTALLAPLFVLVGLMTLTAAAPDTTATVTLSNVHLCCPKCVTGVNTAIAPVTGAKAVCDTSAKTVVLTAPDKDSLQKAVSAIVTAGYYCKTSDSTITVDSATGAPDGKVATLNVTGIHNCCGSCATAINAAIAKVPGVTSAPIKANTTSFTVTGDFSAKSLFDELQTAGFAAKVAAAPK
jgi:copper chaperone CopZ